ncbi:oligopeptide transport system permease protein [Oceanobacillus limi]|uniref:Oligopeptide transport system permease protein n=1 Tax=Oceanobacillus limi TaxID=930131 RepID=A0A1I0CTE6_9BACI|nr:ABC transporter permease subunit [Oceanobacillus limi]SET22965.1 oligopeptide transport system permease protein [Oceanobacillus limi]
MVWNLCKSLVTFILILLGFIFVLLLPREMEVEAIGFSQYEAAHPFTMDLYMDNMKAFVTYFQTEKGFGTTLAGTPILEEVQRYLGRSLKIIIPTFILVLLFGTLVGVLQFNYRSKKRGKILSFFSSILSSIPDFFLFIAIQYLLIKLIQAGLPRFHLFGSDYWYSFIIPLISLMIFPLLHMVRMTVVAMESEMSQEYVRTVLAKGLSRIQAIKHILRNCWSTIINQSQWVMLYIISSLPIIERLSNYNGAGDQLLYSILNNEDIRAFALMLPFLLIMFFIHVGANVLKFIILPKEGKQG